MIIMFFLIFFMVIMDLFSDHTLGGGAKAVWIIFLILFPPITVLVYLIARGKSMGERRQAQMEAAQRGPEGLHPVRRRQRLAGRPDRLGEGPARRRHHHPGRSSTR